MLSLVYVSSAVAEFSKDDLVALLHQSRANNERLGITGLLLYKDGNFIQMLEGPEEAVRSLFRTVSADPRHDGVIRLLEQQVAEQRFPDWSMGFRDLGDPALRELPGYSEFLNEPLDANRFQADPNRAVRLLEIFRQNMR